MEEQHIFHERYQLKRLLGRGNFSEVWLAEDVKTKTNVALKVYAPATGLDDTGLDVFAREFAIVINANQENILRPMHYDVYDRKPYLVLPYCSNGSTQRRLGMFKEKEIWKFLHDVAAGLAFLHGMKPPIIHQDIKPDNVMVSDNGTYMLTDFGVSSHCRSVLRKSVSEAFSSAGTTAYMGPERFGKDANTAIMASDIYSLGVTAFELLTGDVPFGSDGGLRQKKGADIPQLKNTYSAGLRKVINLCLQAEPWKRPTASELVDYAAHGLKGEYFTVKGEKSLIHRFAPFVLAVCLVVGGFVGYQVYQTKQQKVQTEQLRAKQLRMKQQQASIATLKSIDEHVQTAQQLLTQAQKHEENYDEKLVQAHSEYKAALALLKKVNARQAIPQTEMLNKQMIMVDSLLKQACEVMAAKAEYFKDEPEIQKEFVNRVNRIKASLK